MSSLSSSTDSTFNTSERKLPADSADTAQTKKKKNNKKKKKMAKQNNAAASSTSQSNLIIKDTDNFAEGLRKSKFIVNEMEQNINLPTKPLPSISLPTTSRSIEEIIKDLPKTTEPTIEQLLELQGAIYEQLFNIARQQNSAQPIAQSLNDLASRIKPDDERPKIEEIVDGDELVEDKQLEFATEDAEEEQPEEAADEKVANIPLASNPFDLEPDSLVQDLKLDTLAKNMRHPPVLGELFCYLNEELRKYLSDPTFPVDNVAMAFVHGGYLRDNCRNQALPNPQSGIPYDDIDIVLIGQSLETFFIQLTAFFKQKYPEAKVEQNGNLINATDPLHRFRPLQFSAQSKKTLTEKFNQLLTEAPKNMDPQQKKAFVAKVAKELAEEDDVTMNACYGYQDQDTDFTLMDPLQRALQDLTKRKLVTVKDAKEVIPENRTLPVRVPNFSARFNFTAVPALKQTCINHCEQIHDMPVGIKKPYAKKYFLSGYAEASFKTLLEWQSFQPFFAIPEPSSITSYHRRKLTRLFQSLDKGYIPLKRCHNFYHLQREVFKTLKLKIAEQKSIAKISRDKDILFKMSFIDTIISWSLQVSDPQLILPADKTVSIPLSFKDEKKAFTNYYDVLIDLNKEETRETVHKAYSGDQDEYPVTPAIETSAKQTRTTTDLSITTLLFQLTNDPNLKIKIYDLFIIYARKKNGQEEFSSFAVVSHIDNHKEQVTQLTLRSQSPIASSSLQPLDWFIAPQTSLASFCRVDLACRTMKENYQHVALSGILTGDIRKMNQWTDAPLTSTQQATLAASPLNASQKKAVTATLQLKAGAMCVIGPPGTGKTTTARIMIAMLYENYQTKKALPEEKEQPGEIPIVVCAEANAPLKQYGTFIEQNPDIPAIIVLTEEQELMTGNLPYVYSAYTWTNQQLTFLKYIAKKITDYCSQPDDNLAQEILDSLDNFLHALIKENHNLATLPCVIKLKEALDAALKQEKNSSPSFESITKELKNFTAEILPHLNEISSLKLNKAISKAHIIFVTITTLGTFKGRRAHTIILEEAAQATELKQQLLFLLEPQVIISLGDPKQLAPFIASHQAEEAQLGCSFMERAFLNANQQQWPAAEKKKYFHLLDTQYRMPDIICQIVSANFYNRELKSSPHVKKRRLDFKLKHPIKCFLDQPYRLIDIKNGQEASVQLDATHKSYQNETEANFIVELADTLVHAYDGENMASRITIITPYQGQIKLLSELLTKYPQLAGIKVSTIDLIQGGENDIILFSGVRTEGKIGFLSKESRINVTLSRARQMMVVVCHWPTFGKHPSTQILRGGKAVLPYDPYISQAQATQDLAKLQATNQPANLAQEAKREQASTPTSSATTSKSSDAASEEDLPILSGTSSNFSVDDHKSEGSAEPSDDDNNDDTRSNISTSSSTSNASHTSSSSATSSASFKSSTSSTSASSAPSAPSVKETAKARFFPPGFKPKSPLPQSGLQSSPRQSISPPGF